MKKHKLNFKDNWVYILGFILTILYVYSKVFFGDYKLSFTNLMYLSSPWSSLNVGAIGPILSDVSDNLLGSIYRFFYSSSGIHLWNSLVAMGSVEDVGTVLYPLNIVYLLPISIAVFLKSILEFSIGFLGMYLLMREYGVKKVSAAVSGVIYTFSSALVVWHGWQHSDVAILAPLAFLCVEKIIKKVRISYALWLALVIYIMLLAGMPTYVAYFMYLLGVYIVVKTIKKYWKNKKKIIIIFLTFSFSVIIAVLASLPSLINLIATVGNNGYAASRLNNSTSCLEIQYLRTIIYPYVRDSLPMHINESTIYSGIFSLYILFFTFVRIKDKKSNVFWIVSGCVIFLLIFTHCFDFIYIKLPAINTSMKYRVIVLLNFIVAIIVGFNFNDILDNLEVYRKKLAYFFIAYFLSLGIFAYYTYQLKGCITVDTKNTIIRVFLILGIIFILFAFILVTRKKIFIYLLCCIIIFDMGNFAKNYLPMIQKNASIIPPATDTIKYLQEGTSKGERNVSIGLWTMYPSTNVYYDLRDIRAHSFINTNSDMKEYCTAIDSQFYTTATRTALLNIENYNLLKYLSVKYIVTQGPDDSIKDSKVVYTGNDGLVVHKLNEYSERFELIDKCKVMNNSKSILNEMKDKYDSNTLFITKKEYNKVNAHSKDSTVKNSEYVKVKSDKEDYIKLKVNVKQGRFLLFNDYYSKDWKAYVDGKEVPLTKANYLMRSIYINKSGEHVVEFKYEPKLVYNAFYATGFSVLVVVLTLCFRKKIQIKIDKVIEEKA